MIQVHMPAHLFYPELPGGSNQYFRYGPFLRERGVQLHVHTVRKPHHDEVETEVRGIRIRRYELPEGLGLLEELEALTERAIQAIRCGSGPGCVQPLGTTEASLRSLSRLWKARLAGIPSCFHFMMVPVRERNTRFGRAKESAILRAMLSPYRKLLMCSRVMGRAFQQVAGISGRRIEPLPNGIDTSVFHPVDEAGKRALRGELGLPDAAPLVLFVGSVVPRKGVDILLEAWRETIRRHPEASLVIVGSTRPRPTIRDAGTLTENERYIARVREQVDSLPDPDRVIFAGETERVADFYRAADLFAFASHREGLPSVILEAMACGIPCVTAPFIGLPDDGEEYGVHGEHFFRSSHDPAQLAADLARLIEDEDLRRRMGSAAARWMVDTQEMGKATGRLAQIYRDMVEGR